MTSEVAIINASAVALAADSAVTIGSGRKIYNSALKVFSLSKVAPVGVMLYGNGSIHGIPWETVIKSYRYELGESEFPNLLDYANNFLDFLRQDKKIFSAEIRTEWVKTYISGYIHSVRDTFIERAKDSYRESGKITEAETRKLRDEAIEDGLDHLDRVPLIRDFDESFESTIEERYKDLAGKIAADIFQEVELTNDNYNLIGKIAARLFCREIFSQGHSGIVFAGFGGEEFLPSVACYQLDGMFDEHLKASHLPKKSFKVKKGEDCSIIPFAQDDMVASFMEGVNPNISLFISGYLRKLIEGLEVLFEDGVLAGDGVAKQEFRRNFREKSASALEDFFRELERHKHKASVSPILSMVRVLPKDELAEMAESLVNLTAFKRRMTDELETVGGPIDVAVLSKGDGLVWVKRKHYFPSELNQHFFANYFREIDR